MNAKRLFGFFLCLACISYGCDSEESATPDSNQDLNGTYLFGDLSEDVKTQLPLEALRSIPDMGLYPSDIDIYGDYAYVVDSGNNAIHRIHLSTWVVDKAYIDLGQNAAPFAVHANASAVYVSCQGEGAGVYRFDLSDNLAKTKVYESITMKAPTDVVTVGADSPVVLDSEYDYASMSAAGTVYGKDASGDAYQVKPAAENPVFAKVLQVEGKELVAFVTAGVIQWAGESIPPAKSCLEFYNIADDAKVLSSVCMENVSLGRIADSATSVCVGNGLQPKLHCVSKSALKSAQTFENTIAIHADGLGLTTPVAVGENLVVTDFNHDTVSWVRDGEVLNLKLSPAEDAPKGPIDAVYDAARQQILVLNSTSGSIDVIRVK